MLLLLFRFEDRRIKATLLLCKNVREDLEMLVRPHGSDALKPLLTSPTQTSFAKQIPMASRELSDLLMFGMGAYTPLAGFMDKADWRGVCEDMSLD